VQNVTARLPCAVNTTKTVIGQHDAEARIAVIYLQYASNVLPSQSAGRRSNGMESRKVGHTCSRITLLAKVLQNK
jgi:hypothetical protein